MRASSVIFPRACDDVLPEVPELRSKSRKSWGEIWGGNESHKKGCEQGKLRWGTGVGWLGGRVVGLQGQAALIQGFSRERLWGGCGRVVLKVQARTRVQFDPKGSSCVLPKSHYPIKQAFHSHSWNMISGHSWPLKSTQLFPKEFYMPPGMSWFGCLLKQKNFSTEVLSIKKIYKFFSCTSKTRQASRNTLAKQLHGCKAQCSFYRWGNWDPRRLGEVSSVTKLWQGSLGLLFFLCIFSITPCCFLLNRSLRRFVNASSCPVIIVIIIIFYKIISTVMSWLNNT